MLLVEYRCIDPKLIQFRSNLLCKFCRHFTVISLGIRNIEMLNKYTQMERGKEIDY